MQKDSGASFAETIYRKMSDEELQNTLRCETFSDGALDTRQIEMILAEMKRRGINNPSRSPEEAWNEFEQEYSEKESSYMDYVPDRNEEAAYSKKPALAPRHRLVRKLAILAAVLSVLIASLLTVQASGVDVFGTIARWTAELFSFGRTEETHGLVVDGKWPEIDLSENQQFASLQEALDFYGVTEVAEPRWIPDGFTQKKVVVKSNGVWLTFLAWYADADSKSIVIDFDSYESLPANYYEKLESDPETIEIGNIKYNIVSNVDNCTAAWITSLFECYISTPIDVSTLKKIILSMR